MAAAPVVARAADRPCRKSLSAMVGMSLVLVLSALEHTVIGNALPRIAADLDGIELYAAFGADASISNAASGYGRRLIRSMRSATTTSPAWCCNICKFWPLGPCAKWLFNVDAVDVEAIRVCTLNHIG